METIEGGGKRGGRDPLGEEANDCERTPPTPSRLPSGPKELENLTAHGVNMCCNPSDNINYTSSLGVTDHATRSATAETGA